MSNSPPSPQNQRPARLPDDELRRLEPLFETVPLDFQAVLYEARGPIADIYFPIRGVVSAVSLMQDGTIIEVATIGNEGMVGLTAYLADEESPNRMVVQVEGEAVRIEAAALRRETVADSPLRRLIVRYQTAFQFQVSQGVACNGLHEIGPRCCRWVLMTHDRAQADEFPLTHEFLSHMLGVRRVSVTQVLKPLQDTGLIHNVRGRITVLDRKGLEATTCECYQAVRDEFARLFG